MLLAAVAAALAGGGVGLTALPFAELSVPRGEDAAPERITILGPFRFVGAAGGVRAYEAPIPIRPRAPFFNSPPDGMTVKRGTTPFRFGGDADDATLAGTWKFTADAITVRLKPDAPPPQPGEFVVTYPAAVEREHALWRARATVADDAAFVVRSAQVDDVTRHGLYLPAPATAAWDVTIPEDGTLALQLGVIPPEIADRAESDGAELEIAVDGEVVDRLRARVRDFRDHRVSLARFAGKKVRLSFATKDADTTRDHVFVAAPRLYTPSKNPRRAILVFLDTMRRDHLGVYGYRRDTSDALDAWAESAVVFEDARSVAPWTLPSTRTALTGLQPEQWADAATLQERLGDAGWATAAYVGNVYLSSNFDMADGWGEHGCINWPYARVEVDRALDFLARHPDQDALVMVHFMDLHLPYKEPSTYRGTYETGAPPNLPEGFNRNMLLSAARGNKEVIRDYLIARYDQNIRYVDDQLGRLFGRLGEEATVVIFADHGEEFFDHGDLEHGHTLYDELLRIPFIVRSPGLAPRRVDTPVSLLDLTPTVLDLVGLPDAKLAGRSLVAAARGEADPVLASRALAFGRPLYGDEAWGSVKDGVKYVSRSGEESLFDLRKDPAETSNLRAERDPRPARDAMAAGLGREVAVAYRMAPSGRGSGNLVVELLVPGGVAEAWVGDDPTQKSRAEVEVIGDDLVRATFHSTRSTNQREVFVAPKLDAVAIAPTVALRAVGKNASEPVTLAPLLFDGLGEALASVKAMGRTVRVTYAAIPRPSGKTVVGIDEEQRSALEMLGYLDSEEAGDGGGK